MVSAVFARVWRLDSGCERETLELCSGMEVIFCTIGGWRVRLVGAEEVCGI